MTRLLTSTLGLLTVVVLATGCTGVRLMEDRASYEPEIERLQRRLLERPDDVRAMRDLGIIHVRIREYAKGQEYLQRAFSREPDDPATLFYLGLSNEVIARRETAMRFYEKYPEVSRASPYRRLMQGRYHHLVQAVVRDEARSLAAQDSVTVAAAQTSPNIVAVFPLAYQGSDSRYAPLGRGIAEMVMLDLSEISSIRLVERVRLQALMNELELGRSGAVDPGTAARTGRMLGAGRVVGGTYSVAGRRDLHLGAAVSRPTGETSDAVSQEGSLNDLFRLQKALVVDLVDRLNVQLTPQERERIDPLPTRSLQAFLHYSRGLEQEDEGMYGAAARSYGQAAQMDPDFGRAVDAAERAESMEVAATVETALAIAAAGEQPPAESLMQQRIDNLNQSIGAHVIPGSEMRNPAHEVLQELPSPPEPPR